MGLIGRWRATAHAELVRVQGLVQVLMKPRNGAVWTPDDKAFLQRELRALGRYVPPFVLLVLPGSVILLPAYAWFLDRRRVARSGSTAPEERAGADRGPGP